MSTEIKQSMSENCTKGPDDMHCEHWYDCGPCCFCGNQETGCTCDCCDSNAPCKAGT